MPYDDAPSDLSLIDPESNNEALESSLNSVYIIKEHNGKIGIFNEDGELIDTLNVSTITLPLPERERLSNGIKLRSEKELYSLIENYTG